MNTLRYRQTIAHDAHRGLRLPVTEIVDISAQETTPTAVLSTSIVSPYFQRPRLQKIGTGRDTNISTIMITCFITDLIAGSPGLTIGTYIQDTVGSYNFSLNVPLSVSTSDTQATILANVIPTITTFLNTNGVPTPDEFVWVATELNPAGPSSYQTIVTQTGTAAPAVSGSLTPTSSYPSGTTFTWARTGAGVYTLTASTAVFNTSGKTGVFVGTLNNLNASCKAVVTSSTVITLTTAIGSLLGLGLLGLTATNTDALLTQTMVYVQTYS